MKKRLTLSALGTLAMLTVLIMAAGCAEKGNTFTEYNTGLGLSLTMHEGMEPFDAEGFDVAFSDDKCMMSAVREGYAEYELYGLNLTEMTIEEYADLTQEVNGLSAPFQPDEYGNLFVCYNRSVNGYDYFYYSTVRKGSDAFWVISFACEEGYSEEYRDVFAEWSRSIVVD